MSSLQIQRHLRQIDLNRDDIIKMHNHIDFSLFGKITPLALSSSIRYWDFYSSGQQNRWKFKQDCTQSSQMFKLLKQQRKKLNQNQVNFTKIDNRRQNNNQNSFKNRIQKDYLSYAMMNGKQKQIDLQSPYKKLGTLGNHTVNHFNRTEHQKNYILENWVYKNASSLINEEKQNFYNDSAKMFKKRNQSQISQQNIDMINFQQRNILSNVHKLHADNFKNKQDDALNNTAKFTPSKQKVKFIDQQNSQKTLRVDYSRSKKKLAKNEKQKIKPQQLSKQKQTNNRSIRKSNGSPKMSSKYFSIISQHKRKTQSSKKQNNFIDYQQSILKKIKKRINSSVMIFQDSELRTKRHQKDHLQMTYEKERRERQEIKSKINNHPWVIKKYDKVFQIQA